MNFNPEQLEAISVRGGAWCVLAGPGAGKTACLVARYQQLGELEKTDRDILCLTFTRNAAIEMRMRATGTDMLPWPPSNRPWGFRTFHALAYWIVRRKDATLADVDQPDFDDLLRRAIKILDEDTDLLERLQYKWIMVDEANDLSPDQVRLVQRLAKLNGNVFVVGDPNQVIYSFAGSDPDLIVNFPAYFPGGRYLTVGENYRSTKEIVRFCKAIAPLRGQLLDKMRTGNEPGRPPSMSRHATNVDEALAVLDLIAKQAPELDPRGTTAILARTNQQLNLFDRLGCPSYVERVTIHKSKGLQWKHVYLIGCQEGVLPLAGADEEEEARLMFVACSRAVSSLHISFAGTPSRFIQNFLPAEMKQ